MQFFVLYLVLRHDTYNNADSFMYDIDGIGISREAAPVFAALSGSADILLCFRFSMQKKSQNKQQLSAVLLHTF